MPNPLAIWITDTHIEEGTIEINKSIYTQVFTLCKNLGISVIFHGGDIYTSRKGQLEDVMIAFKSILDEAKKDGIKIISIAGNHDKTKTTSPQSIIDVFDNHPAFSVVKPVGLMEFEGGIVMHFLPFYDEEVYREHLQSIKFKDTKIHILLTHATINGVSNTLVGKVVDDELEEDLFDKFDLVLVGHYHNRQIIGKRDHIVYTGSTHACNFGEDAQKGCTILYDDGTYEFMNLEFPKFVTLEALVEDIDSSFVNTVLDHAGPDIKIKLKVGGELTEQAKPHIVALQEAGVKIEVLKEDYKPIDVVQGESVKITTTDLIASFREWAKERGIKDHSYGEKLLKQKL